MMQCTDINELMMDFIYRELEAKREDEFRAHLASCNGCKAELASLERTRHALRDLPDAEPPAAVTARLLHEAAKRVPRAAAEEAHGGFLSWLSGLFRPVIAHPAWAAAASLVVLVGVVYLRETGVLSSKPQSKPEVSTQANEEGRGDMAAATPTPTAAATDTPVRDPAAASEGLNGVTGAVGAAPAPGAVPVGTPPATTTPVAPPAADPNVNLDGKNGEVLDRIGTLESGEQRLQLEKKAPVGHAGAPAKEEVAPEQPYDYRSKGDEPARDKAGRMDYKPADRGLAPAEAEMDDAETTLGTDSTVGTGSTVRGGGGSAPAAGGAPAPAAPAPVVAPRPDPKPQAARPSGGDGADAADEDLAVIPQKKTNTAPPPPATGSKDAQTATNRTRETNKLKEKQTNGNRNVGGYVQSADDSKTEAGLDQSSAKLHQQAARAAKTGNCTVALEQYHKVQKTDPDYFNRNMRNDAVFSECEKSAAKKAKKAAPKAPDVKQEMRDEAAPMPAANQSSF